MTLEPVYSDGRKGVLLKMRANETCDPFYGLM